MSRNFCLHSVLTLDYIELYVVVFLLRIFANCNVNVSLLVTYAGL